MKSKPDASKLNSTRISSLTKSNKFYFNDNDLKTEMDLFTGVGLNGPICVYDMPSHCPLQIKMIHFKNGKANKW